MSNKKCERGAGRKGIEQRPRRRRQHADGGGHAHMLVAAKGDHRAEHRQPQKQHRGEFVRPHQRRVEHVARHHAAEQDHDLGRDQGCGEEFDGGAEPGVDEAAYAAARPRLA